MSKFAPAIAAQMGAVDRKLKKSTVALGAVATGAGVAGAALFAIGSDFDAASDKIRIGTGKTGKALQGLNADFKAVIKGVPATFDDAGLAVSELNQRLGLTGRPLRAMSKQVLELSRITGTDLSGNIREVTRTFGDWGISMRNQPEALNKLFRASQKTGTSVQDLGRQLVRYGAPLRQLGFSFEEAAGLIGKFEKEGVNAQLVLGSLRIALSKMAQQGVKDPGTALDRLTDSIREAGSAGEANAIALEVFGARAGPDMAAAIREGRFDLGNLFKTIESGRDSVQKASRDTQDFNETWLKFKNNVMVALEPVAKRVFGGISREAANLTKILTDPKLSGDEKFSAILDRIGEGISKAVPKIMEAAANAAPKIAVAFVKGFLSAGAWAQLATGAFLISKFGGVAAWKSIGRKVGAPLGLGMAQSAAPAATGGITGAMSKLSPRMRAVGKGVIGAALVAGIGASMTDSRKGLLDRAQDLASILTLGIIPKTKDISERLNDSIKGALTGGELGKGGFGAQVGFDKFLDSLDDKLPAAEKKIVGRFVDLRRRLVDVFGDKAKFKLDVLADPGAALRAFDKLEVGMNRLKNRLAGDAKGIVDVTRNNLKLLPQIMDLHSKAGQRAITKNMKLASQAIVASMRMGSSSTKQGMRAIRTAFVVNSQAAKETTQKNFGLASKAIDAAVQAGLITSRQGLREIRKLFFSYLAQFGIKGRDAEVYMMSVPKSSGGGGKPPPAIHAKGGLVQFGQPGAAGRDNIPVQFGQQKVMVGSGEVGAVFNRHQLPVLNARLSDMGGLPGFFSKFDRKHSMASGGIVSGLKRFASGGLIDNDFEISGHPSEPALERDRRNLQKAKAQQRRMLRARRRRRKRRARELRDLRWEKYGDPNEGPQDASMGGLIEAFAQGGIVGMMAAARKLEKASFPYLWGGGHQATPAPFGPMDCSGAVSYVLQHGGVKIPTMVSGALASAGQPGPGAVTVFANPGHTFMRIGKDYFGTSGTNPGGGAGFFPDPGAGYRANFTQRHFVGGAGDFGTAQQIGKFVLGGPDSPLKAGVQAGLNAARATSNDALENAMVAPIGSGDVGDPGPGGYSKSKLMALWVKAGGPSGVANLAAAVALAESGGQPGASNSNNNGSTDRGLWQINSIHGNLSTFDPLDNARAAVQISSRGSNWNPWVAFTTGKHRQFLERGGPVGSLMEMFTQGGPVGFGGKGKDKGRLPKLKGTLSQKTRQTVKALAASKDKARRAKILKRYAKALKKYGLPNKLMGEIGLLAAAHAQFSEYATNAQLLDVEGEDGEAGLRGRFRGGNEGDWLTKDLDAMFKGRNKLVKAHGIVTRNQKKVQSTLRFVNQQLEDLGRKPKTPRNWEGVNPAKDAVEKWNKQPGPKRHRLMKKWRGGGGKLPGTREFNTFTGKIKETPKSRIPALREVDKKLTNQNTLLKGAVSPTNSEGIPAQLQVLQGIGGSMKIMSSPWPIGTLGGDIFTTQKALLDLFAVPPKTTDDTKDEDARVPLLQQQLLEEKLRFAVSQRQFDVLRNFPPFGGQFATGGTVPGPAGAPRTVIAHGGETITPPGKDSNLRVVIEDNRVRVFKDDVEQIVQQTTRRQARSGGRVLPGRAGGN